MDCWTWSELLDLELGNIPYALKDLANATIWDWSILEWAFHLMQTLSSLGSSVTLSLCLIIMMLFWFDIWWLFLRVCQGIFNLIHLKTLKTSSYWSACLDVMSIFILCLGLHIISWILLMLIVFSKVQRKWVSI